MTSQSSQNVRPWRCLDNNRRYALWLWRFPGHELNDEQIAVLRNHVDRGLQMIVNNPCLYSPLMDEQAIEVALFLGLAAQMGHADDHIRSWLAEMVQRLRMAVISHGRYPTALRAYPTRQ